MRKMRVAWGIAGACGVVGLLFACASLVRKEDRITFSHKEHVTGQGLGCEDCHGALKTPGAVPKVPNEEKCLECHEKKDGKCGQCHKDPKHPGTWQASQAPAVAFPHPRHLEVTGGKCEPCHAGTAERTAPSQAKRPISHEACMSCHRKDFRRIDCTMCHKDLIENPARPTAMFSHDADFTKRHGLLAKGDEAVCRHCHEASYCADCHSRTEVLAPAVKLSERVDRDLVHRGDFLTRHPIEARMDSNACLKCHTVSTCESCHQARGVAYGSTTGAAKSGGFHHPQGWSIRGSTNHHGRTARRDIASCASCHDQGAATICINCHKPGGSAGVKPHRGEPLRDGPTCRFCHPNGRP